MQKDQNYQHFKLDEFMAFMRFSPFISNDQNHLLSVKGILSSFRIFNCEYQLQQFILLVSQSVSQSVNICDISEYVIRNISARTNIYQFQIKHFYS